MGNYPQKITLYKGYHSPKAYEAFKNCYRKNEIIIFLPPALNNYDFIKLLPKGEIHLLGELWQGNQSLPFSQGENLDVVTGVFSSGTSQNPRLVLYSKENLNSSIHGIFELFDRDFLHQIFCYPQPFHTFGLTLGYAAATILNLDLICPEGAYSKTHHEHWLKNVNQFTLTLGTPTHFYDLLTIVKNLTKIPESFSCIIGGAKVKTQLWHDCQQKLKIRKPSIGYGATEASPGITHLPPGAPPFEDGEIGVPLSHVQTQLTDNGLEFSGPNLCTAIIDANKILKPTSFEVPDIIEVRTTDQHWVYKGRSNWFLNRGGEKFSLEGLESLIQKEVQLETLCVGLPDARLGEDLGILVVNADKEIEEIKTSIMNCLKQKTNRDFNRERIIKIDKFPLNENLKKDRMKAQKIMRQQF